MQLMVVVGRIGFCTHVGSGAASQVSRMLHLVYTIERSHCEYSLSVGVSKLQIAILARSSREMSQTACTHRQKAHPDTSSRLSSD